MLIEKLTGDRFFSSHAIAPVYLCNHIADCANKVQVLLAASAAMQTFVGHEIPSSRLIIRIGVLRLNFFISFLSFAGPTDTTQTCIPVMVRSEE